MDTIGTLTFERVEIMLECRTSPFDFPSAKDCRTAVSQLQMMYGDLLGKDRLGSTPVTLKAVDAIMARIEMIPPASEAERKKRKNISTRLRKLARIVSDAPASTPAWSMLEDVLSDIASKDGLAKQKLIPIHHTLKAVALEDGLDPADMTSAWLTERMRAATAKRRESLRDAAKLFDQIKARLPPELCPSAPFGCLLDTGGGQRRSGLLPPQMKSDLAKYLENRLRGTSAMGLRADKPVLVKCGIKPASAVIYDQATKWFMDSLRIGSLLDPSDIPASLEDAAHLDWFAKVAFQALDDHDSFEAGTTSYLPWIAIKPKTIRSRVIALRKMFSEINRGFGLETVPKFMADGRSHPMDAKEVVSVVRDWVDGVGMTPRQRAICLALIGDEDRQRTLLNMHTICWHDAQTSWARWEHLNDPEKRDAIDLCVLAAILAIVVHYPFRASTVVGLTYGCRAPDVVIPHEKKTINFAVSGSRMKNAQDFDAILMDTSDSKPRKILDWFIAGPRQELLRDPNLLKMDHRRPERLFGGINVARYGRILSSWTEQQGMRMTTHGFRHAIATILVNLCGSTLEDVARMLGNTSTEIVSRHYVLVDNVRRRSDALGRMDERRQHLNNTRHPGRREG